MELSDLLNKNIARTLAYSDVFKYPLRKEEIVQWFIGKSPKKLSSYLDRVNGIIFRTDGFFHLGERGKLVRLRQIREEKALVKFAKAVQAASLLQRIPTVQLIGISGSLAMRNTGVFDDIDLVIIAKRQTLWLTRLLSVLLLEMLGIRRRPKGKSVRDKICLNMFLDERYVKIPGAEQNIYTAHEVCQMRVLFNRDGTYQRFLKENVWVREYLPNAFPRKKHKTYFLNPIPFALYPIELFAKLLQLSYMKLRGRLAHATIEEGRLLFYPKRFPDKILNLYKKRMEGYGIPI